jgi:hypothetical protein
MTAARGVRSARDVRSARGVRSAAALVAVLVAVPGSGCRARKREVDRERAAAMFDRIRLETHGEHGLSGLAVDEAGALWSVAERGASLWKVELDGTAARATRFAVRGLPSGEDLEAIAAVAGGGFVVGTEGRQAGVARAFTLAPAPDGTYQVTGAAVELRDDELGVAVGANHGAEGVCAAGAMTAIAIETAGTDARGRWAPIVTIDRARGERVVQRLRLTSARGKIAALDCWRDGARLRAIAIERHFETTRVLGFDLLGGTDEIVPAVLLDLAPVLRGALNLEGVARLPDGRIVAVVDNQYQTITGPDELLVFREPIAR